MSFNGIVKDIIADCKLVIKYKNEYSKSQYGRYAIERSLIKISKSMKSLSEKYKTDWERYSNMIKIEDILNNSYSQIDNDVIANMINNDLSELIDFLNALIR